MQMGLGSGERGEFGTVWKLTFLENVNRYRLAERMLLHTNLSAQVRTATNKSSPMDCLHARPPGGSVSTVAVQGTYRNA
jgi:hypothetical protein